MDDAPFVWEPRPKFQDRRWLHLLLLILTVGTTTPVLTFLVPASTTGTGFIWNHPIGFAFSTAITVACTTGAADNDTGAPAASSCIVNVGYA